MTNAFDLLTQMAMKGTLVLLMSWLISLVMRRNTASARHLVWILAFGALVILPVSSMLLPEWRTPAAPEIVFAESIMGGSAAAKPISQINWRTAVVSMWAAGATFFLCRLLLAAIKMCQIACRAVPPREWNLPKGVRVAATSEIASPLLFGLFRPLILVPASSRDWSPERKQLVLSHELAHVERGDHLTHWLARTVTALYWFHPLAWVALRQMTIERERACDDRVLSLGAGPAE